jgi:hypothetical protein
MRRIVVAVLLAFVGLARAEEPTVHEGPPGHEGHEAGEAAEEKEAEPILEYTVDLALGAATFDALSPAATENSQTFERRSFFVASLLLGAEHSFGALTLGVRIPVLMGTMLASDTAASSGVTAPLLGNLEVEANYRWALSEHWSLDATLEVAAPTAMGEELPVEGEALVELNHPAILRGELLRAAEFSRGSLDTTLFEPAHVGLIPKLAVEFHAGNFRLRPQVKVETLISTKANAAEPVILELVAGVRASYTFAHVVEPTLYVWTNLTLTDHVERDVNVVLVEPGVRFFAGRVRPSLSVVVPVYGRLLTDAAFSVRVGLVGEI